jgi:hypothetical protein
MRRCSDALYSNIARIYNICFRFFDTEALFHSLYNQLDSSGFSILFINMTTPTVSPDDASTKIDGERFEMFRLIWLDHKTQSEENRDTRQRLRGVINRVKKFHDVSKCQRYIEQMSSEDRLIMIVNGRLGQTIVPNIHQLRQVISIYVYCMDKQAHKEWTERYVKVKSVRTKPI